MTAYPVGIFGHEPSGAAPTPPGVWRKSGECADRSDCVEVTVTYDTSGVAHKSGSEKLYLMRDSKNPDGPVLAFTEAEWEAFILGVKDGEFDLPEDQPR